MCHIYLVLQAFRLGSSFNTTTTALAHIMCTSTTPYNGSEDIADEEGAVRSVAAAHSHLAVIALHFRLNDTSAT